MNKALGKICLGFSLCLLSACQSGQPSGALSLNSKTSPTSLIVSIAKTIQTCWFKSHDPAFKPYRLASEVNSYAGRPRLLLVPRKNPGGLPTLVVQAEQRGDKNSGKFTNLQTYGPILQSNSGKRITDDIKRWSLGSTNCKA